MNYYFPVLRMKQIELYEQTHNFFHTNQTFYSQGTGVETFKILFLALVMDLLIIKMQFGIIIFVHCIDIAQM